jgi:hypothetical protein
LETPQSVIPPTNRGEDTLGPGLFSSTTNTGNNGSTGNNGHRGSRSFVLPNA